MTNFQKRTLTGLALMFVAIVGLFTTTTAFILLFAAINFMCLWEFFQLVSINETTDNQPIRRIIGITVGFLPFVLSCVFYLFPAILSLHQLFALVLLSVAALFIVELFLAVPHAFKNIAYWLTGLVYIGLPFALLIPIHFEYGNAPVIGLWFFVAAFDVAAYLVGSRIGKTPLSKISPKKTWEGVGGGMALLLVFFFLMPYIIDGLSNVFGTSLTTKLSYKDWAVIAFIALVFGTLGDLVESMLKRSLEVKDSSNFLPGHGGFLDRFDSVFFQVFFVAAYLFWY